VTGYLLDTNVLSEVMRPKPDPGVVRFLKTQTNLWLSVISLHELAYGLQKLPSGQRRQDLTRAVEELKEIYAERILAITSQPAERSAELRISAQQQGKVLHLADALLAGTALSHGLTLVTRNLKDFEDLPLRLLNPWSD
jgi:predicted nucleic acid-binding protein